MKLGTIFVPPDSISWEYTRSSGPGGQNVNKVATATRLIFDLDKAQLSPACRQKLEKIAGSRLVGGKRILIRADNFRTREGNRRETLRRLRNLLQEASLQPKTRKPTRPTKNSQLRRLKAKKHRARIKLNRQPPSFD